ncbi:MAG: hypothetical protein WA159_16610 [Variovorax sp.]
MIVLNAAQEKVLAALKEVSEIVERQHTLLEKVLSRLACYGHASKLFRLSRSQEEQIQSERHRPLRAQIDLVLSVSDTFFSNRKLDLRNAP